MRRGEWHLRIRWAAAFEPVCWLRGHDWGIVEAGTAFDWSGRRCGRCARFDKCVCGRKSVTKEICFHDREAS